MAYEQSIYEIINIGNNRPVKLSELIEVIEKVLDKKATINRLPEQPGDVPVTFANIEKAKSLLHYEPATSLEEGIDKFYQWMLTPHYFKS